MKYSLCLIGVAATLLGLGQVHAQQPGYPPPQGAPVMAAPPPGNGSGAPVGANGLPYTGRDGVSEWLAHPSGPYCGGPVGGHGPIGSEVFLRTGVAIPLGDNIVSRVMGAGFMIQGGGRSLFFDRDVSRAWTVELGIASVWLDGGDNRDTVTLRNFAVRGINPANQQVDNIRTAAEFPVSPSSMNQTYVQLALGREIWFMGTADPSEEGARARFGWDVGSRWGSARMVLHQAALENVADPFGRTQRIRPELRPRNDVVGGLYLALHSDLEVPCGMCLFHAGVRLEYGYIWSDILQPHNNADFQSINILFNTGVRF
jgi:hypothetical protein